MKSILNVEYTVDQSSFVGHSLSQVNVSKSFNIQMHSVFIRSTKSNLGKLKSYVNSV